MREVVDNLVIGGGPAGAAAAIQLATNGREVMLLERKPEAHDKVCGEFISWEAAQYLTALGVNLAMLGAEPVTQLSLIHKDTVIEAALPFTAWSLSRRRLDAALLERAAQAGAKIRCGTTAKELRPERGSWAVSLRSKGPSARSRAECLARHVFLASGKYDLRHWQRRRPQANGDRIGFKMHFHLASSEQRRLRNTVELHLFDHGYAGIEPVEDGKANLCFLVSRDVYQRCNKSWPELLDWLGQRSPQLRARLAGAAPVWPQPLAVYGTPYGYVHRPGAERPGLYRLGDQMAVTPSLVGDGIAIALHSGVLAASLHDKAHAAIYHREALKHFRGAVRRAELLAGLLSFEKGRRLAFWLATHRPELVTNIIQSTRLPLRALSC